VTPIQAPRRVETTSEASTPKKNTLKAKTCGLGPGSGVFGRGLGAGVAAGGVPICSTGEPEEQGRA